MQRVHHNFSLGEEKMSRVILLIVTFYMFVFGADTLGLFEKSEHGYRYQLNLPVLRLTTVDTLGEPVKGPYEGPTFDRVLMEPFFKAGAVGAPELPVWEFNIVIPTDSSMPRLSVKSGTATSLTLERELFPQQKAYSRSSSRSSRHFTRSTEAYKNRSTKPLARVKEISAVRGIPYAVIEVSPFQYDPQSGTLTYHRNCTIEIGTANSVAMNTMDSPAFANFLRRTTLNYDDLVTGSKLRARERYLIISAPQFESGLADFVSFRSQKYEVDLFTTAATGTSPKSIHDFITARYNDLSTRPTYLLFVGDVEDIPQYAWNAYDKPYGDLTGNGRYDVFMGRFSVRDAEGLQNIIYKTKHFEQNVKATAKSAILVSGKSNGIGGVMLEDGHENSIDVFFDPMGYSYKKFYYNSNYSLTEEAMVAALNEGSKITVYSGHGGPTGWYVADNSSTVLKANEMLQLTNSSFYPAVYNHACLTGKYKEEICVGEALTTAKGGAAISWASFLETHFDYDDLLQREHWKILAAGETHIVTAFVAALAVGGQHYNQFICFGDPALDFNPSGEVEDDITVTYPNGGERFEHNELVTLRWSDNISGDVAIDLYQGGTFHSSIASSVPSSGSYEWSIPYDLELSNEYSIRITCSDDNTLFDESNNTFTVVPGTDVLELSKEQKKEVMLYPIPVTAGEQLLTFRNSLSSVKEVQLAVFDQLGNKLYVNTMDRDSIQWDLRMNNGHYAGKGSYAVLFRAIFDNGEVRQCIKPFVVR